MTDQQCIIPLQEPAFDHCKVLYQFVKEDNVITEKPVLTSDFKGHDSPRVTVHREKVYCYHIVARVAAEKNISGLYFTLDDLMSLHPEKSTRYDAEIMSLMHLCGNKWCVNCRHYYVGTKVYNDQQAACHFGLHNALTPENYHAIQDHYCKHSVKCWANLYSFPFNTTKGFMS